MPGSARKTKNSAKDYGEEVDNFELRPIPITSAPCRIFRMRKFEETDELEQSVSNPRRGFLVGSCDPEGSANPRIQTIDPNNQQNALPIGILALLLFAGLLIWVYIRKDRHHGRTDCPSSIDPYQEGLTISQSSGEKAWPETKTFVFRLSEILGVSEKLSMSPPWN